MAALSLALALCAGLAWAGWYVYNRGFTRKWRQELTAELRARGLDFTATRLTLNPFEGLVAEDAHLYLRDKNHSLLLYISRVAVDINLFNLIQKKPFLNALDLRGARLSIPLDLADPDGPKLRLRRFQAKVSFQPGIVQLTQAQGDFHGLHISVSGEVLHPDSFQQAQAAGAAAGPADLDRRRSLARGLLEEIGKVRAEKQQPRLEIHFQADLANPRNLRVSALLEGEALRRGNYRAEHLLARLNYSASAFHLPQFEITDAKGTLGAQGDFDPSTGEARGQLQSTLDVMALAHEFLDPTLLDGFGPADPPKVRLEASAHFPASAPGATAPPVPEFQLTGHASLGPFDWKAVKFQEAGSDFSWKSGAAGQQWYLHGLRMVRPGDGSQALTADILHDPAQLQVRLTSSLDPAQFASLLPTRGRDALADLRFTDPPRVTLTASTQSPQDLSSLTISGQMTLGRTRYKGVGFNRLRSDFTYEKSALSYRHFTLDRDEGSANGDLFVYDFGKHEVRLENVRASVDPAQVCLWIDSGVARAVAPYHFRKPPATVTNGVVQFDGGRNSRLTVDVNAPAGMDYVFLKKPLKFQNLNGQVLFTDDRLRLNGLKAETFGGAAQGDLDLSLVHGAQDYRANIDVQNLDFAPLTKLYFDYDTSKGAFSGNYHFTGRGDDAATLHGAGHLAIDHGNVFAIPFLGPLSSVISSVLPGLGFDVAHQASADFLTAGGKIYTGNLAVKGLGFSLFGGGWLGYLDDTMNFRIRINGRGLPGAVLYPVSKLFEYGSQGPLSKPVWRPRVLTPAASPPPTSAPGEKPPAHLFPSPAPESKPLATPPKRA